MTSFIAGATSTAGGFEFRTGHRTKFPEILAEEGESDVAASLRVAVARREAGNESFGEGTYVGAQGAVENWGQGLLALERIRNLRRFATDSILAKTCSDEELALARTLLLNLAQALLKLHDFEACVRFCDCALELDPASTKALWRKAKAVWETRNPGIARETLHNLLDLQPENAAALQLLQEIDREEVRKRSLRVGPRPGQVNRRTTTSATDEPRKAEEAMRAQLSPCKSAPRTWWTCCRRKTKLCE